MRPHPKAFTLLELLIVIVILALLSLLMAFSFNGIRNSVKFDNAKNDLVNIIQKARSLSLSNILINDTTPTDFYLLTLAPSGATVKAYGINSSGVEVNDTLETLTFETGITLGGTQKVYYFPPYGDVCFSAACSETDTSKSLTFSSEKESVTITIEKSGGYVNIN